MSGECLKCGHDAWGECEYCAMADRAERAEQRSEQLRTSGMRWARRALAAEDRVARFGVALRDIAAYDNTFGQRARSALAVTQDDTDVGVEIGAAVIKDARDAAARLGARLVSGGVSTERARAERALSRKRASGMRTFPHGSYADALARDVLSLVDRLEAAEREMESWKATCEVLEDESGVSIIADERDAAEARVALYEGIASDPELVPAQVVLAIRNLSRSVPQEEEEGE